MKAISVTMSWRCIKQPRCSFCYHQAKNGKERLYDVIYTLEKLLKKNAEAHVSWEYSGYNLGLFEKLYRPTPMSQSLTTIPSLVDVAFTNYIAKQGIGSVALSFDSEKSSYKEWCRAAEILQSKDIHVSCNYLLETEEFPVEILEMANQLNLLVMKPTGHIENKEQVSLFIEIARAHLPVAVDNCLGVQLGFIDSCKAGELFTHILPDGTTESCSFGSLCYLHRQDAIFTEPDIT